jgi:hypothetical protein
MDLGSHNMNELEVGCDFLEDHHYKLPQRRNLFTN